jgi:hypothetical protein
MNGESDMLTSVLNVATLALLGIVLVHSIFLHFRISGLRRALADAGAVLPSLDAATLRMGEAADVFTNRVQGNLQLVEGRLASARRTAADLTTVMHSAEEMATQLDRQVRQSRRLDTARAAAIPRELVEPKGFAEHAGLPAAQASPPPPPPLPPPPPAPPLVPVPVPVVAAADKRSDRLVRMNML